MRIEQRYLHPRENGVTERVRVATSDERTVLTYALKRDVAPGAVLETETEIDAVTFVGFLAREDTSLRPVRKVRRTFDWKGRRFELDQYEEPSWYNTLELEVERLDEPVELPDFLRLVEVTGRREYSNAALARIPHPAVAHRVLETIRDWWKTLADTDAEGIRLPFANGRDFYITAEHSHRGGLLGRMLSGLKPLPKPPPPAMSRPWYVLAEHGFGVAHEVWSMGQMGGGTAAAGDEVIVDQAGGWTLVEVRGPREWVIEHPGVGACLARKTGEGKWTSTWEIEAIKPEPREADTRVEAECVVCHQSYKKVEHSGIDRCDRCLFNAPPEGAY